MGSQIFPVKTRCLDECLGARDCLVPQLLEALHLAVQGCFRRQRLENPQGKFGLSARKNVQNDGLIWGKSWINLRKYRLIWGKYGLYMNVIWPNHNPGGPQRVLQHEEVPGEILQTLFDRISVEVPVQEILCRVPSSRSFWQISVHDLSTRPPSEIS